MNPTFDMDALRSMVLGIELGSFARAAVRLGRSQSAVSMQLRKLEQQAGRPLFRRDGRGLVPTEAGEALLAYARRIVALNDEAAAAIGAAATEASVRMGLPQDYFEDVMPDAIRRFARHRPGVHVEVRAGRNHVLEEEIQAGRLDVAIAYFPPGSTGHGQLLGSLPQHWYAGGPTGSYERDPVPLVLFDHPCLFRQAALRTLDGAGRRWRLALTTPSLPGIWAALRLGHGVTVRTAHRVPDGIGEAGGRLGLPVLPPIELRMLVAAGLSPAATALCDILEEVVRDQVTGSRTDRQRRKGTNS